VVVVSTTVVDVVAGTVVVVVGGSDATVQAASDTSNGSILRIADQGTGGGGSHRITPLPPAIESAAPDRRSE
jgi:hypothetical protein